MNSVANISMFLFVIYCVWSAVSIFGSILIILQAIEFDNASSKSEIKWLQATILVQFCVWSGILIGYSFRWFWY